MKVWIARDKSGILGMYTDRPIRSQNVFYKMVDRYQSIILPRHLFPEITWDDEPVEFELKRKEGSV